MRGWLACWGPNGVNWKAQPSLTKSVKCVTHLAVNGRPHALCFRGRMCVRVRYLSYTYFAVLFAILLSFAAVGLPRLVVCVCMCVCVCVDGR